MSQVDWDAIRRKSQEKFDKIYMEKRGAYVEAITRQIDENPERNNFRIIVPAEDEKYLMRFIRDEKFKVTNRRYESGGLFSLFKDEHRRVDLEYLVPPFPHHEEEEEGNV